MTYSFHQVARLMFACALLLAAGNLLAQTTIPIETDNNAIVLQTDNNNVLRTVYTGKPLMNVSEYAATAGLNRIDDNNNGIYNAAYTPSGTWNITEPAITVKHADGNPSLELKYVSHDVQKPDANSTITKIILKDNVYPF